MNYGDSISQSVAKVTRNTLSKEKFPDVSPVSRQKVNPESSLPF